MTHLILLLLAAVVLACGPVKTPTPGGLVVFYTPNEKRLSSEKAAELDARHAALIECLPPEAFCRTLPPTFAIEGRECDDQFWDGTAWVRGYTWLNGTHRVVLPGSLGAAAHEMAHYYTCQGHGATREEYRTLWPSKCGDVIDGFFRKQYPPRPCQDKP